MIFYSHTLMEWENALEGKTSFRLLINNNNEVDKNLNYNPQRVCIAQSRTVNGLHGR